MDPSANTEPTNQPATPEQPAPSEPSVAATPAAAPNIITPTTPAAAAGDTPEVSSEAPADAVPDLSTASSSPLGSGMVVGGEARATVVNGSTAASPVSNKKPKKKKVVFASALLAVLLLAGGGAVFGLYLPNRPANVFGRGLERTGTALNDIVNTASQSDMQAKYKNETLTGKLDASADSIGSLNATFDGASNATASKLDITATVTQTGGTPKALTANTVINVPAGKQYPNLFFQVSGLQSLGLDALLPGIGQYDNKWFEISSDYFQQLASSASGSSAASTQSAPTAADVTALAKSLSSLSQQYIFTSDSNKSILEQQAYLGKETLNGVSTSHFRVGFNKANFKAFCTPLADTVFSSDAVKKNITDGTALSKDKADFLKSCQDQSGKFKASDTLDMWFGGKYGLLRQVRVYDDKQTKDYVQVGQKYSGGDSIPFYVDYHAESSDKADVHVDVTLNTKTAAIASTISGNGTSSGSTFKVSGNFALTPSSKAPVITEPTGAVDVGKLLQQIQASAAQSQAQALSQSGLNI